jgi:hypothetical protein
MIQNKIYIAGRIRPLTVWFAPAFVFAVFGAIALLLSDYAGQEEWYLLSAICIAALAYALLVLASAYKDGAARLFTDPFLIFTASFSLYFLFGPLFLIFGNADAVYDALTQYPASPSDALLITGMNLIGFSIALLSTVYFTGRKTENMITPMLERIGGIPQKLIFAFFLIVGGGASVYVISFDLSSAQGDIISGTMRMLSTLSSMAIMVGILYRGRGEKYLRYLSVAIAVISSFFGLIQFNKTATIIPLIILNMAFYLRTKNIRWVFIGVACALFVLLAISNPVLQSRRLIESATQKDIQTRMEIFSDASGDDGSVNDSKSTTWARFCYLPPQVSAVRLYDENNGGQDLELLGWVFLPRALFPGKPIMTRSGTDLNYKISGIDTSSLGIGLFISAYYNEGWLGLLGASIIAGWILSIMAAFSRAVIETGSMLFLPVAQLGSFMAFRIDGHFVADYLGNFGMVVAPLLSMAFLLSLLVKSQAPERAWR